MLFSLAITVRLLWNGYRFKFHDNSCAINMPMPETHLNLTPVKALNLGAAGVQDLYFFWKEEKQRATAK